MHRGKKCQTSEGISFDQRGGWWNDVERRCAGPSDLVEILQVTKGLFIVNSVHAGGALPVRQ